MMIGNKLTSPYYCYTKWFFISFFSHFLYVYHRQFSPFLYSMIQFLDHWPTSFLYVNVVRLYSLFFYQYWREKKSSEGDRMTGLFLLARCHYRHIGFSFQCHDRDLSGNRMRKRKNLLTTRQFSFFFFFFFWRSYSFSLQGNFGLVMVAIEWTIHTHIMTFSSRFCVYVKRDLLNSNKVLCSSGLFALIY